ncbi:hypothetical protein KR222_008161 [Zaprionus bogoriensis]|nr:hypothetical protein KR222_008161 [Zaprionus bogoriensis]
MCRRQFKNYLTCTLDSTIRSPNLSKKNLMDGCGNQAFFPTNPINVPKMLGSRTNCKAKRSPSNGQQLQQQLDQQLLQQLKAKQQKINQQQVKQQLLQRSQAKQQQLHQQQMPQQKSQQQQHKQQQQQQKHQQQQKKAPQQAKQQRQQQQQQQQQPGGWVGVVVHWTRSERDKYSSIKLLPPW